jgi:hypothetical protein
MPCKKPSMPKVDKYVLIIAAALVLLVKMGVSISF